MKNIYIWFYVDGLTDNYHDGGGLVIIASSLQDARESFSEEHPDRGNCDVWTTEPDEVIPIVGDMGNRVYRFKDAGCC